MLLFAIDLLRLVLFVQSLHNVPELGVVQLDVEVNLAVRLVKLVHLLVVVVLQKFDLVKLNKHFELDLVHLSLLIHLLFILLANLVHLCLNLCTEVSVVLFFDH